jgi:predicted ester cyclase
VLFRSVRCSGTHDGEVLGFAPTRTHVAYDIAAFFTREGSFLTEAWVLGDLDALRRQLAGSWSRQPTLEGGRPTPE